MDGGSPAKTGSTLVVITVQDVNDNEPVFRDNAYQFRVAENSEVGVVVGRVTAVDEDQQPYNEVYYHLADDDHSHSFTIDKHNGQFIASNFSLTHRH